MSDTSSVREWEKSEIYSLRQQIKKLEKEIENWEIRCKHLVEDQEDKHFNSELEQR